MIAAEDRLDDPASYQIGPDAPECDMVMKGGITSGVVYPRAACRLATRYRLRRLGGASAGAIAAALAAAAERGRGNDGFVKLNDIPNELGTALVTLFQPSKKTVAAFDILLVGIDPELGGLRKILRWAWLFLRHAFVPWSVTLVLATLPALAVAVASQGAPSQRTEWLRIGRALLVWLPLGVLAAFLAAAIAVAVRTLKALPENGYGLCDAIPRDLKTAVLRLPTG